MSAVYVVAGLTLLGVAFIVFACIKVGAAADRASNQAWEDFSKSGDAHQAAVLNSSFHDNPYANEGQHDHA